MVDSNKKWILYTNRYICEYINEYTNVKKHFDKYCFAHYQEGEVIKERCTGIIDIEKVRPEESGNLNI